MVHQILSSGVQDGNKAELGAKVFGIGANGAQRLGAGVEENIVERLPVL
jgi:hypothetical protein